MNNRTGAITLGASDVGAETPENASKKANIAEANSKAYTEQKIKDVNSTLNEISNKVSNIKVPVTSVNGKTGAVVLNSNDIRTNDGNTVQVKVDDLYSKISTAQSTASNATTKANNAQSTADAAKKRADEAFQYANNGKKYWVDIIGYPLDLRDSFSTLAQKTQFLKNEFVDNLKDKGRKIDEYQDLGILIGEIRKINTGKKSLSGVGSIIKKAGTRDAEMTVSGLDFQPNIIIIKTVAMYKNSDKSDPEKIGDFVCIYVKSLSMYYVTYNWYNRTYIQLDQDYYAFKPNSSGFNIHLSNDGWLLDGTSFSWYASE